MMQSVINTQKLYEAVIWTLVTSTSSGYKKAVLPQGNRAMPQLFFSV